MSNIEQIEARTAAPKRWSRRSRAGAALMATAGLGAGLLVGAGPASADASGCDTFHNVCIAVTGGAGETVTVTGSTNGTAFGGTFTLSGPAGISSTSPDEYWDPATSPGYGWSVDNAPSGEYCVSGYDDSGNSQGMACETVS